MNDQLTDQPSLTRRLTDAALIVVAISALATWIWRRFRTATPVSGTPPDQAPRLPESHDSTAPFTVDSNPG
jgi:hypothetical protein